MRVKAGFNIFIIFFLFSFLQTCSHKQELSPLNISFENDLKIGAEEGDENYMLAGVIDVEVGTKKNKNIYILDWKKWAININKDFG